ncbi:WD repeat domain 8, partial [Endogone sp. FLAS-F59071]
MPCPSPPSPSTLDAGMNIDFSDLYKKEPGALCLFSPDGAHIATAVQLRLVVRDAQTLQVEALYDCADSIQQIAWSADSLYLLSASFKKACVEIWSVHDHEWSAKVEEGIAGLVGVRWAPDARTVLCFSEFQVTRSGVGANNFMGCDFGVWIKRIHDNISHQYVHTFPSNFILTQQLRVTIWNLGTKETSYIQYPKFPDKGLDFRSDNRYAVLAERRDSKDFIGVYDCHDWSVVKHFASDTVDLDGLAWSPDGKYIAVWENVLDYKILIYTNDGRCLTSYSAYHDNLGVKSVAWSPSGQFLAVGSYDQK